MDISEYSLIFTFLEMPFGFIANKTLNCLAFQSLFSIPDEGYSRKESCALNPISTYLLLSFGRYLCWWTIYYHMPSRQWFAWFVRYIYYWNLQFQNNWIINKTKVLLPHAWVTLSEFVYPVKALCFTCSQNLKLFSFPIFRFWASSDEGYSRNVSCALNSISMFVLLSLGRYLCW